MAVPANETTFRQYLAFFFGQQVSLLGSSIAQFAVVWWITLETASTLYLSLAAFVGFVPIVVLGFFTGVVADRFNRKAIIAIADSAQALITVFMIVSFVVGWASITVVLLLIFLRGVCQAFHMPTVGAIIPSMVPLDRLSRINSLGYVFNGAVYMAGPVIAAIMLAFLSIEQILWVDPATFLVAIAILLLIRIPSVRQGLKTTFRQDFSQGLGLIRRGRGLLTLIFLATALNFLIMPLSTLLPYFVRFDHFGGAGDLALVEAVLQGGMLAGGFLMLMLGGFKRKIRAFVAACIIVFAGYAVVSFTPTGWIWFMAAATLILSLPLPAANISVSTIIQMVIPLEFQGRVTAVIGSLASLASPVGMIMAGVLASYVGTASLFLGCAVAGILVLVPAWFLTDIRHVEEMKAGGGAGARAPGEAAAEGPTASA